MFLVIFNKGIGYFFSFSKSFDSVKSAKLVMYFNIDVIRVDSIHFSFEILQMKFSSCFSIKLDVHVGF